MNKSHTETKKNHALQRKELSRARQKSFSLTCVRLNSFKLNIATAIKTHYLEKERKRRAWSWQMTLVV